MCNPLFPKEIKKKGGGTHYAFSRFLHTRKFSRVLPLPRPHICLLNPVRLLKPAAFPTTSLGSLSSHQEGNPIDSVSTLSAQSFQADPALSQNVTARVLKRGVSFPLPSKSPQPSSLPHTTTLTILLPICKKLTQSDETATS